ncbi:hypothetical protein JKP88DRAFT_257564 [Tribonema minus]|uniref:EGF-like domain-containing protein n=1 Tax=Tribonema minus TaxID=303371 RepID=A0A836CFV3_9STRA|nr:hypothetical protein JKP88DRAFT_257564 [Tribonema minus]
MIVRLLLLLATCGISWAACPNFCSGHGDCGKHNVCKCDADWNVAPDCSLRSCPSGTSWASNTYMASNKVVAHTAFECSNVGTCNRKTGTCTCPAPFTGSACQRLQCPNDCSEHGFCATLRQASEFYTYAGGSDPDFAGTGPGSALYIYDNWDADSSTTCICDWGFTGADCSMKMCPKGDDPVTTAQDPPTFTVDIQSRTSTTSSGIMDLVFYFGGESVTLDSRAITAQTTTPPQPTPLQLLKDAIKSLSNIEDVTVTTSSSGSITFSPGVTATQTSYEVAITAWPTLPHQNNVFWHDGSPPLAHFGCSTSSTGPGASCSVQVTQIASVKEYQYCSRRGSCDFSTGQCECYSGFTGPNCAVLDSLVVTSSNIDVTSQ